MQRHMLFTISLSRVRRQAGYVNAAVRQAGGMHDASGGRQRLMSTIRGCTPLYLRSEPNYTMWAQNQKI